jgi:hypothetical protein
MLAGMRDSCLAYKAPVLAGLAVIAAALYRIATVPTDDYDSLCYHIPFLYEWVLDHRFTIHPQAVASPIGYYPCHWEALCALFHIPFRSDLMLLLPNAAALGIWVLSSYGIARRLGAAPGAAQGLSLALATLPIVQFNVQSLHVDLPFAAFFTAAVFFAVRQADSWTVSMPAFAGCIGMMCGIKTPGPIYAVGAFLVLCIRPEFRKGFFMHVRSRWFLVSLGLVIGLGGAWYFRNLFLTGNPFGVLRVAVGPFVLFDGLDKTELFPTTLLSVADWGCLSDYGIIWEQILIECGPFWPSLIVAGMLLPLLTGLRSSRRDMAFLILALALCLGLYLITPYSGDNGGRDYRLTSFMGQAIRYAFPLLALVAAAASVGFSGNARTDRIAAVAGMALCAGTALTAPPVFVLLFVSACVGAVYSGSPLQRMLTGSMPTPFRAAAAAGLLILAVLCVFPWLAAKRDRNTPAEWDRLYRVFEERQVTRMAYTRSETGQLWYGRRMEIRPYPLGYLDPEGYAREMRRLGVRILVVGPIVFPVEEGLRSVTKLFSSPEFNLLYSGAGTRGPFVFELVP